MYDYKLIEAYAAVLLEEGFEKAARKLNITQSAISQRIKSLEEQFGQILLVRTNPPQPTVFGRKIIRHYNQVNRLENDLRRQYHSDERLAFSSLPIGINADTLATWFFQAVKPFLKKSRIVLDLLVDDQDETHQFLRDGRVLGCVSTKKAPIQGCSSKYLGDIEYSLFCSKVFREVWFSDGVNVESVKQAPMITFNRKDRLNLKILRKIIGTTPVEYATHYVPSTELFLAYIQSGIAYGAIPDQQSESALQEGSIIDLSPNYHEVVPLYWHHWNIDSEMLKDFSAELHRGFKARVSRTPLKASSCEM